MHYTWRYVGCFLGTIPNSILSAMLNVFPIEIHGAILVANPGLIYGAMLFMTFFWRLFLALSWDANSNANYCKK